MKKNILSMLMIACVFIISCNSDNDKSLGLNPMEQKVLGTWEVRGYGYINNNGSETIESLSEDCYNTYTFNDNMKVNYKYFWDCSDMNQEEGSWYIENNLLTREFPKDVSLVMKDSIVFITDNKIKLYEAGDNSFSIYEKTE